MNTQELWNGLYLRWIVDQNTQEKAWNRFTEIKAYEKELKLKTARLRRFPIFYQKTNQFIC